MKYLIFTKQCVLNNPLQGNALATMVSFLTYGNRRYEELDSKIRPLLEKLYKGQKNRSKFIDADTDAFNSFVVSRYNIYWYVNII